MSELENRLIKLLLRLDHMGMRCEQAVLDALEALRQCDVEAGGAVDLGDAVIDREEVEIEQECIRLLALYQPAAIDLRTLCTVIKVNSDLERIADLAAGMGRRVKHVVEGAVSLDEFEQFALLAHATTDMLGRTVRILAAPDASAATTILNDDDAVDRHYAELVRNVLQRQDKKAGAAGAAMTVINLAKALERIGDLCTNIAEDIVFLRTGEIVRHAAAFM